MEKDNVVLDKSFLFAIRIVNLFKLLKDERGEYVMSKQLLRSGTAVGAILSEGKHAQSYADFINKVNVALKEANESAYWLRLLKETNYISEVECKSILVDCEELIKLMVAILKTSKERANF